jgi:30S ribosomal protein S31
MGKGDKKSKRGKIILGSFGVRRPHRPKALAPPVIITKKVEKTKSEKPKAVKDPEAISEILAEPGVVSAEVMDQPVVAEKKTAKPKAPKKTTANAENHKDISTSKTEKPNDISKADSDKPASPPMG